MLSELQASDALLELALVLLAMAVTGWFLGAAATAGWWFAFALALVVLCGELVGLKQIDQQLQDPHPA